MCARGKERAAYTGRRNVWRAALIECERHEERAVERIKQRTALPGSARDGERAANTGVS